MFSVGLEINNSYTVEVKDNNTYVDMGIENEYYFDVFYEFDNGVKLLTLRAIKDRKLKEIINLKMKDILYEGVISNG